MYYYEFEVSLEKHEYTAMVENLEHAFFHFTWLMEEKTRLKDVMNIGVRFRNFLDKVLRSKEK